MQSLKILSKHKGEKCVYFSFLKTILEIFGRTWVWISWVLDESCGECMVTRGILVNQHVIIACRHSVRRREACLETEKINFLNYM